MPTHHAHPPRQVLEEPNHPLLASLPEPHAALSSSAAADHARPPLSAPYSAAMVPMPGSMPGSRAATVGGGYITRFDDADSRAAWATGRDSASQVRRAQ